MLLKEGSDELGGRKVDRPPLQARWVVHANPCHLSVRALVGRPSHGAETKLLHPKLRKAGSPLMDAAAAAHPFGIPRPTSGNPLTAANAWRCCLGRHLEPKAD